MAADTQAVTATPVNIVSAHSLDSSTTYEVYNSGGETVYLWEAASSPTVPVEGATKIHPDNPDTVRASVYVTPDSGGDGLWAYTLTGDGFLTIRKTV